MRILFVASRFPFPPLQGDQVRAYHQLRILSQRHSLTLVTPMQTETDAANLKELSPFCERIETIPVSPRSRAFNLIRSSLTPLPLQTLYFFDPRIRRKVQSLFHEKPFDLAHVQLIRMAPAAVELKRIPKVIDLIDALSLNLYRRAELETGLRRKIINLEADRVCRYERALADQYDRLIVSTPVDRANIGSYDNISVIPNGVDVEEFPFVEHGRDPHTIVFTGRISYFPNTDAVTWFATEVFPKVRQEVPNARFLIVGANPPRPVRRLGQLPGVQVTGYVAHIQDYLAQASVAVCPMRAGSGIQNKVLEAMACGTPVVTTPDALYGIEAKNGEHLIVADKTAGDFAKQVVRLLKHPELGHRLANNARRLVMDKYTWNQSVAGLEDIYNLAVDDSPPGRMPKSR